MDRHLGARAVFSEGSIRHRRFGRGTRWSCHPPPLILSKTELQFQFARLVGSGRRGAETGVARARSRRQHAARRAGTQHRCVTLQLMPSVTSCFRMSKELQRELSDPAQRSGKAKNALIIEALVKYLHGMARESLAEEARRQSVLVSRNEQDADGYAMADISGWR